MRCALWPLQFLGIGVAPQPAGNLGQHPDGRDIGGVAPQAGAQRGLGNGPAAVSQCQASRTSMLAGLLTMSAGQFAARAATTAVRSSS